MAEIELDAESTPLNIASKISEKEVNTCSYCEELRLEPYKAKLEIPSY